MNQSLRRRITAALSITLATTVVSPAIAHAAGHSAWTVAIPSHPKLVGSETPVHAEVLDLVPLSTPPAPPTPHLTGTFVSNGAIGTAGTITTASTITSAVGSSNFDGASTIDLSDLNDILNKLLNFPSDNHPITLLLDGTPVSGFVEPVFGANGSDVTGLTFIPVTTPPILGGVLTLSSGSATDSSGTLTSAGTLTINDGEGITTIPPTLDLNTPIIPLNGPTLTSTSGSFNINAVISTPEPASFALLTLAAPLLLKRRRA